VTAAVDCTPVSWLRLERYALGELDVGQREDIAEHLATCTRCRACADLIAAEVKRELPPLPAGATTPPARPARPVGRAWPWWFKPRAHGFALAAALALVAGVFALRPGEHMRVGSSRVVAVKGGDVAVELVREHDGSIAWEPTSFSTGDRLKLLVTCAPPLQVHADIVVVQNDGPTFVGVPALLVCGNRVPVPPAFRITDPGAARVCVLLDANGPPSRSVLPDGTIPHSVAHACVSLERAD
jgi:Putative zinc-finger